jgi:hypothetical protein
MFEFLLNKWFKTTFRPLPGVSDIYIVNNPLTNNAFAIGYMDITSSNVFGADIYCTDFILDVYAFNQTDFTIFVPLGFYTTLNVNGQADNIIRSIADRYNIAGMIYDIQTY